MKMPKVVFVHPDGHQETHPSRPNDTIMDVALDHAVPGILAQCGGGCTCSTCHCHVDAAWREHIEPPSSDELELLEFVYRRDAGSRLACQIFIDDSLDGIVVRVPERQT
ncbi:MAG: 2Fe-2S ferredoxin [Gammaproteobacteria bacterium]|jgi:2Fe-2S ferredoxin